MTAAFDFKAIKADNGNYLIVEPEGLERTARRKVLRIVESMIATKLRATIEGQRVTWRRPKHLGPETFKKVREAVDMLDYLAQFPPSYVLCDVNLRVFKECDGAMAEAYNLDGTVEKLDRAFHLRMEAARVTVDMCCNLDEDAIFEGTTSIFMEEDLSNWHKWWNDVTDCAPYPSFDTYQYIETTRRLWVDTFVRRIVDCYVCAICEQSFNDKNLISKIKPPRGLRKSISRGYRSVDYRIMLSRNLQNRVKNGQTYIGISPVMRKLVEQGRMKEFNDWVIQQDKSNVYVRFFSSILFAKDPNVILDFKMRFG